MERTQLITTTGKAVILDDSGDDILDIYYDHREDTLVFKARDGCGYVDIPLDIWPLVRDAADEVVGSKAEEPVYDGHCACGGPVSPKSNICAACWLPKA